MTATAKTPLKLIAEHEHGKYGIEWVLYEVKEWGGSFECYRSPKLSDLTDFVARAALPAGSTLTINF